MHHHRKMEVFLVVQNIQKHIGVLKEKGEISEANEPSINAITQTKQDVDVDVKVKQEGE